MKAALFAFNGDPMCFIHVMLNTLDLKDRGYQDVQIVLEGTATRLVQTYRDAPEAPFAGLWRKVRESGLVACACKACSGKLGVLEAVQEEGLALCAEMSGHPSIGRFIAEGYQVYTF